MSEMVQRVARAIYEQRQKAKRGKHKARSWGELSPSWQAFWRKQSRAAIEAMRAAHTLEMQVAGMEALCFYNIERDGPAKPSAECKTPDDWMMRGANIAGRIQSGEGMSRVFNAMLEAALSNPPEEEGK